MASADLIPFAFYRRLNPRERTLLWLVLGTVFVLLNLFAVTTLAGAFNQLRRQCADQALTLKVQRIFANEQPKWVQRMAWLKSRQPALANRDRAGTNLLDQVQQLARGSAVVLTNPQIKPLPTRPGETGEASQDFQAVTVEVDSRSDWAGIKKFIESLQKPDSFLVFDLATLRSDTDPATIKGHFQISKWYAPSAR